MSSNQSFKGPTITANMEAVQNGQIQAQQIKVLPSTSVRNLPNVSAFNSNYMFQESSMNQLSSKMKDSKHISVYPMSSTSTGSGSSLQYPSNFSSMQNCMSTSQLASSTFSLIPSLAPTTMATDLSTTGIASAIPSATASISIVTTGPVSQTHFTSAASAARTVTVVSQSSAPTIVVCSSGSSFISSGGSVSSISGSTPVHIKAPLMSSIKTSSGVRTQMNSARITLTPNSDKSIVKTGIQGITSTTSPCPPRVFIQSKGSGGGSKVILTSNKLRPSVALSTGGAGASTIVGRPNALILGSVSGQSPTVSTPNGVSIFTAPSSASEAEDSGAVSPKNIIGPPSILHRKRQIEEVMHPGHNQGQQIIALLRPNSDLSHPVHYTLNLSNPNLVESSPSRKRSRKQHLAEIRSDSTSTASQSSPGAPTSQLISAAPSTSIPPATALVMAASNVHHQQHHHQNTKTATVRLISDSSVGVTSTSGGSTSSNAGIMTGGSASGGTVIPVSLVNYQNNHHHSHHYSQNAYMSSQFHLQNLPHATILNSCPPGTTLQSLDASSSHHHHYSQYHHQFSEGVSPVGDFSTPSSMISMLAGVSTKCLDADSDTSESHLRGATGSAYDIECSIDVGGVSQESMYSTGSPPRITGYVRPSLPFTCSWKPRQNHFQKHSDVRTKKESKTTLSDLLNQKQINRMSVGWHVSKAATQFKTLKDIENDDLSTIKVIKDLLVTAPASKKEDVFQALELIENICQHKNFLAQDIDHVIQSANDIFDSSYKTMLQLIQKYKSKRPARRK